VRLILIWSLIGLGARQDVELEGPGWMLAAMLLLVTSAPLWAFPTMPPQLLTDPFLQQPTADSVRVVWFTEFPGERHTVQYGLGLKNTAIATTTQLTRTREDQASQLSVSPPSRPSRRPIWRHEAEISPLPPDTRIPYRVTSLRNDGQTVSSDVFSLAASPSPGQPFKLLLTSDHQLKPMTAANLQKVVETVGAIDGVLFAGDLVNVPDRASEWFDDARGGAFFPALQGRAQSVLERNGRKTTYTGGALIQSAPLFPAIGNHEVMGRALPTTDLDQQFNDPVPLAAAQSAAPPHLAADPLDPNWLKDHAFNTDTYEEMFTVPGSSPGGKKYYATTFGDLRLVVLYATTIWRSPSPDADVRGRYQERSRDLQDPTQWGHGHLIFEPIAPGSPQFTWLQQELHSPEFQQAKYKVVMFHHPPHSLGINSVPAYTDPVQTIERDAAGAIAAIRYTYPKSADYLIRDVVPLLEQAGTQLVFYGHSHLWNRFISPTGMHFLETSNVGNSYGAYLGDLQRDVPPQDPENYAAVGNPNGLAAIVPTLAPLLDSQGQPQPYIASNEITVFSIFDAGTGSVHSYRFDTSHPQAPVVEFDVFTLKP
jgi:Calcineurin-like phosphoesterase